MSFIIELNEDTATLRRVPFRLFTSNGTTPDTGASNDTIFLSVNGATRIVSAGSVVAIDSTNGMYYNEPSQSNVSVLGSLAVYHDDGDFPQHIANVQVVNNNPMSDQSNIPLVAAVTNVSNATIAAGDYSAVTVRVDSSVTIAGVTNTLTVVNALNDIDGSGVTLHAGVHSNATVRGVDNYANLPSVTIADADYSAVTVRVDSSVTIAGVTNTLTVVNALNDIDGSGVTIHAGGIATTAFAAGAIDAAALATDAGNEIADATLDRNMGTGADSGTSAVRTARDALRSLRNRVDSDSTQIYVYEENDTTIAWTASISTAVSTDPHITGADPNS